MAAELLAQRQWVTQQTDFMQESLQQHLHTRAALENARHIPCNMACNYYHESKLSIAALCTVYTEIGKCVANVRTNQRLRLSA